ncbi:MAG TPA: iron-sulfur cluster insertion protein ErpA [Fimbriimonas sp.]|nr:iron-sulfur cluster insertion protein ErpA [Fimbriimonas sp.]
MAISDPMTETTIEPSEITLSDRAADELKGLITENGKENSLLRVWVQGGGCSGLSYGMALDDNEPEEGDKVMADRGVRIVVDEMSLRYMKGAVVDYVDDVLGGGFKIENPNAVRSCGCGSSFSTDEEGMPGLDTSAGGGCGSCGCH